MSLIQWHIMLLNETVALEERAEYEPIFLHNGVFVQTLVVLVLEINQVLVNIFENSRAKELVHKQQVLKYYAVTLEPGMLQGFLGRGSQCRILLHHRQQKI